MFNLKKLENKLTIGQIEKLIETHKQNFVPRLQKNEDYYNGNYTELNAIIAERSTKSSVAANRKIERNLPEQIVGQFAGYLLGEAITYSGNNTKLIEILQEIDNRNYADSHNNNIAVDMGKYGYAIELLYQDANGKINYTLTSPINTVLVYTTDLDPQLQCVIRYFSTEDILTDEKICSYEVYYADSIEYYSGIENSVTLNAEESHEFGSVPCVVYKNNKNMVGDFQKAISLITQYQLLLCDIANKTDYTKNVKMVANISVDNIRRSYENAEGDYVQESEEAAVSRFVSNPTLFTGGMDLNDPVKYIAPNLNVDYDEFAIDKFRQEIFSSVGLPDLDNNKFAGNQSGEALKLKLFQTNQIVKNKERNFVAGLRQRIELIADAINFSTVTESIDREDIEFVLTRGLQTGIQENTASIISAYEAGLISKQTAMARLLYVTDINKELKLMESAKNETETIE